MEVVKFKTKFAKKVRVWKKESPETRTSFCKGKKEMNNTHKVFFIHTLTD